MDERYDIALPLRIDYGKKKVCEFILNLNHYRNAHQRVLAEAKVAYTEAILPLLRHLPVFSTVRLVYTLYVKNAQLCDTSNPCSIIDKFFSDALVDAKKIEDDNYTIVHGVDYRFGGIDRNNPRCEVSIIPTGPLKEDPMKIVTIFDAQDLRAALLMYAGQNLPEGHEVHLDVADDFEIQLEILPTGSVATGLNPLGLGDKIKAARKPRATSKAKETAQDAPKTDAGAQTSTGPGDGTSAPLKPATGPQEGAKANEGGSAAQADGQTGEQTPPWEGEKQEAAAPAAQPPAPAPQPEPEKETPVQEQAQAAASQRRSLFTPKPQTAADPADDVRDPPGAAAATGTAAAAANGDGAPRKSLFSGLGKVKND